MRDLFVTADHALFLDVFLVQAGALINGETVTLVPMHALGDTYTVYQVETDAHEIILANGAPAETYIDYVARRAFDNFAEYLVLYGEDREIVEMAFPRVTSPEQVPDGFKARLAS